MSRPRIVRSADQLAAIPVTEAVQVEFSAINGGDGKRAGVTLSAADRRLAVDSGVDQIALAESRLYPANWKPSAPARQKKPIGRAAAIRQLENVLNWLRESDN